VKHKAKNDWLKRKRTKLKISKNQPKNILESNKGGCERTLWTSKEKEGMFNMMKANRKMH